jgi:hypothetical protein
MTRQRARPANPIHDKLNSAFDAQPILDHDFYQVAFNASKAFRGEELRRRANRGVTEELIDRLLRPQSLTRDERAYLARLISGEIRPATGRPARNVDPADEIARVIAKALRPRPSVDREVLVSPLITWLRSERPIDPGGALILAQLLAGQLNPTGRPAKRASENASERELIFEALSHEFHLKALWKPKILRGVSDPEAVKLAEAWLARKKNGFT